MTERSDSDDAARTLAVLTAELGDLKAEKRVRLLTFQLTIALVGTFLVIALLIWGFAISATALVLGVVVFVRGWSALRVISGKLSEVEQELGPLMASSLGEASGGNGPVDMQD